MGLNLETLIGILVILILLILADGVRRMIKERQGRLRMRIDPRYFRPLEVETLLGDPSKAKRLLGWEPKVTAREMCREMVKEDLKSAKRLMLLKKHGLDLPESIKD